MFQMFFRSRFLQWIKGPGARWATSVWETILYNAVDLAIAMAGAAFLYALAREAYQTLMGAAGNARDQWGGGRFDDDPPVVPHGDLGGQGLILANQEILGGADEAQAWEAWEAQAWEAEDADP